MSSILNFLVTLLFLSLLSKGNCQCSLSNVQINQSATGIKVQDKPEWLVTITSVCPCVQENLKLSCDGFQTVESIDSSILAKSGTECLVNGGQSIGPSTVIIFKYAWDTSFPFNPLSSTIRC